MRNVFLDRWGILRAWVIIVIGILIFGGVFASPALIERLHYRSERQAFEALRLATTQVHGAEASGVYLLATQRNQDLARAHICLQEWWCAWTEDARWTNVAPIAIPEVAR